MGKKQDELVDAFLRKVLQGKKLLPGQFYALSSAKGDRGINEELTRVLSGDN